MSPWARFVSSEPLDPHVLPGLLRASGWESLFVDDAPDLYLAVAQRAPSTADQS